MAGKDKDQQDRKPAKNDAGGSEKQRAKDLKPPKDKAKDVKGGGKFR